MATVEYARMVMKSAPGLPTIPPSSAHDNGDWDQNDIYEFELYIDSNTGLWYTRVGATIIPLPGSASVIHDATLTGNGTVLNPLSVIFGKGWAFYSDNVTSATTSNALPLTAVASSFTYIAFDAGDRVILCQYYWNQSSTANDARFALYVDGVLVGVSSNERVPNNASNQRSIIFEKVTLTAGLHTIELRFGAAGGTNTINNVNLQIHGV